MNSIRFACTSFTGTQKEGKMTPDKDGYYDLCIGGLNVFNSANMYYSYDAAKSLFEESSQFMRRIKRGALKGEEGHPSRLPGESMDDFINRYITIDEKNVCSHFSEIYLNFKDFKGPDGKPIVAIMGKVTGSGHYGEALNRSLANPKENVCFSIRSFTNDYVERGVVIRALQNIITFDRVTEPGISYAEKFKSPAIESLLEKQVTKNQILHALNTPKGGMAMESSKMTAAELFKSFGWTLPNNETPIFSKW